MKKLIMPKQPMSIALALVWLLFPQQALAGQQEAACGKLFEAKKYVAAASCFAQIVKQPLAANATPKKRIARGRLIRNIALSHTFAARNTKVVGHAAYQRAQAVQWLKRYQREKLFESPQRQSSAQKQQEKLEAAIGYATLTIAPHHKAAQVHIQGYRFDYSGQGKQTLQVRPGEYKISVAYKGTKPQEKQHTIQPRTPTTLTFAPQKVPPKRPILRHKAVAARTIARRSVPRITPKKGISDYRIASIVMMGVGAAILVTASITFGVGRAAADQSVVVHANAQPNPTLAQTEEINTLQERGTAMIAIGGGLFGGAGAALLIGSLMFAADVGRVNSARRKQERQRKAAKTKQKVPTK